MPLETLRKPVQTFSGGGSYPTTGDDTKRTSEAVIESEVDIVDLLRKEGYKVVEGAEAVREAIRRSAMAKEFMNRYERNRKDYGTQRTRETEEVRC